VPAAEVDGLFEPFRQLGGERIGTSGGHGLGLAIVRAIADAHGGTVSAGESPEGGARIELELPGFTPAHVAPRPDRAHAGETHAGAPARAR
jgi:signal transduction histidine kinase